MITPSDQRIVEKEFRNDYGESWRIRIDLDRGIGHLSGDETGGEILEIRDNAIQADFGLNAEEYEQLAKIWLEATGEKLQPTWMNQLEQAVRKAREHFGE